MQQTTNARFLLALFIILAACFTTNAQKNKKRDIRKDRASDRLLYERAMLVDPKTGKIPEGIYQKTLEFIYSPKSHLQPRYQDISTTSSGISGATWTQRGPHNVGGRTRALAIDKMDENVILAGGVSGGMWRSSNGGRSWAKVTGSSQNHSVTAIAQDPQTPATWYYSAGEGSGNSASGSFIAPYVGHGVYKSTDNGLTWVLLNNTSSGTNEADNPFRITWNVKVHPTNGHVYVANAKRYNNGQSGIWRSTDGGTNWALVLDGGGAGYTDIAIDANGVFYATISSNGTANKGIYRSTDGTNWTNINPSFLPSSYDRIVLDIAPSNNNVVYFYANAGGHNFYKYTYASGQGNGDGSNNNGGTWENRSVNLPTPDSDDDGGLSQANYNQYVKVKPDNENIVFIGSTNMFRSTDGFASKTNTTWIGGYHKTNFFYPGHHPDNHSLVFFPSNPKKMISGHDGGISLTEDNLATGSQHPVVWSYLNNGYYTTQIYGMDIDAKTAGDPRLSAGFQDNGKWTTHSFDGTAAWKQENFYGDGAYTAIVPGKDIRFFSNQNGHIFRVTGKDPENPTSAVYLRPSALGGYLFVTPYILDPNNSNIMYYLLGGDIYRNTNILNTNTINSWERIGTANVGSTITTISASEDNPTHRVYYGTGDGKVYRLDNANLGDPVPTDVWTGKGFPENAYVSNIAIDPTDANKVFVVFSNYGVKSVFYSADAGNSWTAVSGNLEENADGTGNGPSTRWLRVHVKANGSKIYFLGTSVGLYATTNLNGASTNWIQEGANTIGNVPVVMIKSRRSDGLVALGTHGTGLFSGYVGAPTGLTISNVAPERGEIGSEVIVNGTGFSVTPANNTVKFNNTVATVTAATANNLTVTVPAGATTGKVSVTVGGTTVTSTNNFTVVPAINNYPYTESFETGIADWKQVTTDGFDWSLAKIVTPTGATGPTKASEGDFYLYTEIDQYSHAEFKELPLNKNKSAQFVGPTFDLSGLATPYIFFAYHMYGSKMGTLTLEASTDGTTWNSVWTKTGDQGNEWKTASVDLSGSKSATTKLRFTGATGDGSTSDIAIDAITVGDIGTPAIVGFSPGVAFAGFTSVIINGTNFDTTPANNTVSFNGVAGTVSAATATQLTVKVPATATSSRITVVTGGKTGKSASYLQVISPITTFPYAESFEAGLGKWTQQSNDDIDWTRRLGKTPSSDTGPDAAVDGSFYLHTEATGNAGKVARVMSAPFDISGVTDPMVAFQYHMKGNHMGTLTLEASTDGTNWTTIWTKSGHQGNDWFAGGIGLDAYKSSLFVLRFTGTVGENYQSDISIDKIQVLEGPRITGFTPATGQVGTAVTIQGTKFSTVKTENIVKFNGKTATVTSASANQIVATVPATATTGKISVVAGGLPTESNNDFTVIPSGPVPTITSINPMIGVVGQEVTIKGTGFTATKENNRVLFNGKPAVISSATTTQLVAKAPQNVSTGKITVINEGGQSVVSADDFVVYCVSGATDPSDSRIDKVVFGDINKETISACATYSNFSSLSTKVVPEASYPISVTAGSCGANYDKIVKIFIDWNRDGDFNDAGELIGPSDVMKEPATYSATVNVPADAKIGMTRMRVVLREASLAVQVQACDQFDWGETEDYSVEVVQKPAITGFSPDKGEAGTEVIISGSNFSETSNIVKFNGTAATVLTNSATSVKVTVPKAATTGKVTVEANGGVATSAGDFTVIASTVPAAPTGLAFTIVNGMVRLTWKDNSDDETAFHIERSAPEDLEKYVRVGEVLAGVTEYNDDMNNLSTRHQYRVRAINAVGASAYSNVVVFESSIAGIKSILLAQQLKITPNPNSGKFNIEVDQARQTVIKVKVVDVKGQVVRTLTATGQQGKYPVDLTTLPQGVYTLHITLDKAQASIKYVKQ